MKKFNFLCTLLAGFIFSFTSAQNISSSDALQKLIDGNKRFVSSKATTDNEGMYRVKELEHGQHPFAIIISCSDSRVSPEIVFDEGLGDLFIIRNAGNIVDEFVSGSIEYAAKYLGSPLIFVMGHTECGAVHAAVEPKDYTANINKIVAKITPAVNKAKTLGGDLMEQAVHENVLMTKSELENNPELKKLIDEGKLKIASGVYYLETGAVEFIEQ